MDERHPEYPILFSPLRVGPLTLRNRIVNSAHQTGFARSGRYTDQLVEYHRERARGGAALIVSQATSVTGDYLDLYNADEEVVPAYRAVAKAVGEHGAHYSAELYHPGSQGEYTGRGAEVYVAPSSVPASYLGGRWRVAHELTEPEILAIVDAFAAAARRCREGGLSGIELHFAHGNLVEQFISPTTNRRTDDWGGELDNRLRFAELITRAVREAAGPGLAVGARLTAAGLDKGEPDAMDMAEVIGTIGTWDCLDYVSLTMGHYSDALNTARNIPNMTFAPGLWQKYGRQVRSVVDVPVFMVGRVNHPRTAEDLLEAGACDAVVMARALIADPHLPEKARTGRTADIRPCVGAMNCMDSLEKGHGIRCIHNPRVGHELDLPEEVPAGAGGARVVVVGGGPAGLEAARVAAVRGHRVTLLERGTKVGGQAATAARTPDRGELGSVVEWLERQCADHGVDIRTGVDARTADVAALDPDLVVVATGSVHPAVPSPDAELTASALARLQQDVPLVGLAEVLDGAVGSGEVVVYDAVADWPGFNVARVLAERGCRVRYLTPEQYPGAALEVTNWRLEYAALSDLGVEFLPVTRVVGSTPGGLVVRSGYARSTRVLEQVDTLVWIAAPLPVSELGAALAEAGLPVLTVGDAYAPRSIEQAILDARIAVSGR
ncbi:oxidoreductase [Nocardioides nitrophenolicus]|uniref:oxidoreductase n=1 Tax=Nocardioides nitrophenolicus TaxID=60489 RepID=UPI00195AC4EB|nr:FAD-dependent oxidoreductase [Nocardioides nitrophenolicus]MBM7518673.1 2,4-dienoyl-CoA reductase-like NADH-dependent reductase (Old Yellow Enzyme family) [Nocardioides nitrophenolicus]